MRSGCILNFSTLDRVRALCVPVARFCSPPDHKWPAMQKSITTAAPQLTLIRCIWKTSHLTVKVSPSTDHLSVPTSHLFSLKLSTWLCNSIKIIFSEWKLWRDKETPHLVLRIYSTFTPLFLPVQNCLIYKQFMQLLHWRQCDVYNHWATGAPLQSVCKHSSLQVLLKQQKTIE